jgi:hypothetical protein
MMVRRLTWPKLSDVPCSVYQVFYLKYLKLNHMQRNKLKCKRKNRLNLTQTNVHTMLQNNVFFFKLGQIGLSCRNLNLV